MLCKRQPGLSERELDPVFDYVRRMHDGKRPMRPRGCLRLRDGRFLIVVHVWIICSHTLHVKVRVIAVPSFARAQGPSAAQANLSTAPEAIA